MSNPYARTENNATGMNRSAAPAFFRRMSWGAVIAGMVIAVGALKKIIASARSTVDKGNREALVNS